MPTSGSKTVNVQLECYDFWTSFQDSCQDSYTYDQAVANKYSCANANGIGCNGGKMSPRNFDLSCEAVQFSATPSKDTVNLYSGQTETIPVTLTNQMTQTLTCDQGIGSVAAGGSSATYKITVSAPSTGSGTTTASGTVSCTWAGETSLSKTVTITVNYQSDPCISALNDARNAVSDASAQITKAQTKIQEANKIGADTTTAQASLNQANSYLSTAQTSINTAQTSCNSGDRTNGASQATNAKNNAQLAKDQATNAFNGADQALQVFQTKKLEAQNKITQASNRNDDVKTFIEKTEGLIYNATQLGWDVIPHQSAVKSARAKVELADKSYKDATTALSQSNFDLAKQNADSAKTYADEAYTLVDPSFRELDTALTRIGEVAKAVLEASAKVSQMNEISNKLDYIVRSTEKQGVDLGVTKSVITDVKSNIDQAEDTLSQAQNQLKAGTGINSAETISLATDAATKADAGRNRLDTILTTFSTSTQDALEKAIAQKQSKVASAEAEINSASQTYGANPDEIVKANSNLSASKASITEAQQHYQSLQAAVDFTTVVDSAQKAFAALDSADQNAQAAIDHAGAAKFAMIATVGTGAAVAVGAAGGGFLYWRKKKKGKHRSEEKEKHKEKKK